MLTFFNRRLHNRKGFTLIELIVVIAILGILIAIAVPRLGGFTDTAEKNADEATARVIEGAAAMYYADQGDWPADIATLVTEKYLDKTPVRQQDGGVFDLSATDGQVTVTP